MNGVYFVERYNEWSVRNTKVEDLEKRIRERKRAKQKPSQTDLELLASLQSENKNSVETFTDTIRRDINRTFPDHIM